MNYVYKYVCVNIYYTSRKINSFFYYILELFIRMDYSYCFLPYTKKVREKVQCFHCKQSTCFVY